jgi:hypothetical protein
VSEINRSWTKRILTFPYQEILELRNSDKSLMAFVCPSMLDALRRSLFPKLKGCFNGVKIFENRTADLEDEDELECPFFNCYA